MIKPRCSLQFKTNGTVCIKRATRFEISNGSSKRSLHVPRLDWEPRNVRLHIFETISMGQNFYPHASNLLPKHDLDVFFSNGNLMIAESKQINLGKRIPLRITLLRVDTRLVGPASCFLSTFMILSRS